MEIDVTPPSTEIVPASKPPVVRAHVKRNARNRSAILTALGLGASDSRAARACGMDPTTLRSWLEDDEEFAEECDIARSKMIVNNLGIIQRAAAESSRNWTASAWLLERIHPDSFALKNRVELTGKGGAPVALEISQKLDLMSVDELRALAERNAQK